MDSDGSIDDGALTSYLAENLDEEWNQIVSDAVTECVTAVNGTSKVLFKTHIF